DPDIISMLKDFVELTAPVHGLQVSLEGFRDRYAIDDRIQFIDYSTQELQSQMTPAQVLDVLMDGNERFRTDQRLRRDLTRQTVGSSQGQHPLAVILSCIDSRSPAELIFDLGLGDIFSIRVAGNIVGGKILGSMEYATEVAGAKLIMVLGHSQCGAVTAAIQLKDSEKPIAEVTGCQHLNDVISRIEVNTSLKPGMDTEIKSQIINQTIRENVVHSVKTILNESQTIQKLVAQGKIAIVGAVYHVDSGITELLQDTFIGINPKIIHSELRLNQSNSVINASDK
ncbi:MAG: Carbonic anhydrase 2, partial [Planctomycetota bacterium]